MVPPSSQWRVLFAVKPSFGMPLHQVCRFRTMVLLMQASVYKSLVRRSGCAVSEPSNRIRSQDRMPGAGAASLPAATWITVFCGSVGFAVPISVHSSVSVSGWPSKISSVGPRLPPPMWMVDATCTASPSTPGPRHRYQQAQQGYAQGCGPCGPCGQAGRLVNSHVLMACDR